MAVIFQVEFFRVVTPYSDEVGHQFQRSILPLSSENGRWRHMDLWNIGILSQQYIVSQPWRPRLEKAFL